MQQTTIVAKVFLINTEGLILTLRRSKTDPIRPLTWDLPGGSVEYGEDPTAGAIRETKEEAGLDIEDIKVFITKTTNKEKYVIRLLYYAYTDNDKITLSFEHDDYQWVSKEEFIKLDIPDHYKDCIQYLPK